MCWSWRIRSSPSPKDGSARWPTSSRAEAIALADQLDKDPRLVQVILADTQRIVRAERGVLICETHHGLVCANAGVDASNVPGDDVVVLLPEDPDASARGLRHRLRELTETAPAIVITDTFGRAWRNGQVEVAIGCAGLKPFEDWRGRTDALGRELKATWIAVADELAAAADLARTKDGRQPVVLIRGAGRLVTAEDGPGRGAAPACGGGSVPVGGWLERAGQPVHVGLHVGSAPPRRGTPRRRGGSRP